MESNLKSYESIVICGFAGIGKTELYHREMRMGIHGRNVYDLDSSLFDKVNFPENYITKIKELMNRNENNIILVSCHQEVRELLTRQQIKFNLIYPDYNNSKEDYLNRYLKRGSSETFIQFMSSNFDKFLEELTSYSESPNDYCYPLGLHKGEYLTNWI